MKLLIGKNGKPVRTPDNYEEVTEANSRIEGDVFNDPYYSDGIQVDEIMKEVGEQAPSIKKASGGIARLGYQVGGDVSYDATDSIYGSSAATFTPDTVMDQFGNQVQADMGNNFNKPLIPQVTEEVINKRPMIGNKQVDFDKRFIGLPNSNVFKDIPAAGGVGQDSAREAYTKAQQDAKKQRDEGFRGRMVLPGEMSFEDFSGQYNSKLSGLQTLPVAGGIGGLGEIDMPIAGGNNNEMGILPVMPINQLPGFSDNSPKDARFRDPGPGIGTGEKLEQAQYYTGKDYGPGKGMAYSAIAPQRGMRFVYDQNGGRHSVPIEGYEGPVGNPIKSLDQDKIIKFASGGIARMLGE